MKWLDRIALFIFADIVLIISIIICALIFGWLDFNVISNLCFKALTLETPSRVLLVCSIIFILLALKAIFFSAPDKEERSKGGALLENENGQLVITGETLQNIVISVAKEFKGIEEVHARIVLDKENNIVAFVNLTVNPNVIIKDVSVELQEKVKAVVKQTTDLDVKEVNVRIKNIVPKPKERK